MIRTFLPAGFFLYKGLLICFCLLCPAENFRLISPTNKLWWQTAGICAGTPNYCSTSMAG